ncbi:hypothetical protein ABIC09_003204 [Bradyrhizobium sp. S3.12.5]|uniref:hypothetical protein n=1 Tax=Bradyrhizobium sp. S3.12.5 TaxID=3156386 RepID=UPI003398A716
MRLHQAQASTLEKVEATVAASSSEVPRPPVTLGPRDFSNPDRDEVLALLKMDGELNRTIWLIAGALVIGFGAGWAGGFGWYSSVPPASPNPTTLAEAPSRRVAEPKSGGRSESLRKTATPLALRRPPSGTQVSAIGAGISAKTAAAWSDGAHLSPDYSSTAFQGQADMTVTGSIATSGPVMPAPETRPTTIEGWTVLDVRGGTAVLAGPDGVRMATRGDTVPGIGRIDSIVRWGNHWIVATDGGLIATP